jgi:hypothetical protein
MKILNYIKHAANSITAVVTGGKLFRFDTSHQHYNTLVEALDQNDLDRFLKYYDVASATKNWASGKLEYKDGFFLFEGNAIRNEMQTIIERMVEQGEDVKPLINFCHFVYQNDLNVSQELYERRIDSLYRFLTKNNMAITEDGHFIAYKYVRVYYGDDIKDRNGNTLTKGDYVDAHTGKTHRNNVGDRPSMPVEEVDNSLDQCASRGLHVGNVRYCRHSENIVLVKVNPAHVVVCPHNEPCKVRVTEYEVIKDISDPEDRHEHGIVVYREDSQLDDWDDADLLEDWDDDQYDI